MLRGEGADGAEGDPVIGGANLIDKEAGRGVHVADDGGKFAIVPEIADGEAARRFRHGDARAGGCGNVSERAVAIVVIENARLLVIAAEMLHVHFGIDVAVDEEQIGPAVVVKIEEHGAPAEILRVQAEAGGKGDIVEGAVAVAAIER